MSQKLALVAAAAVATVQAKGFCATLGGLNICNEQVEAALESEKINITGCVTIGGVQICKNSEEQSIFDEESQGFCVEYKGIKVCKEEIDAALESEKIDITGCVKIGKVEICKNSEESVFDEEQKFKIGNVIKGIGKVAKIAGAVGLLEEEAELEEQKLKLGNIVKGIGKAVKVAGAVGLLEDGDEKKPRVHPLKRKLTPRRLAPISDKPKYIQAKLTPEQIAAWKAKAAAWKAKRGDKRDKKDHRRPQPAVLPAVLDEESQGFCVEWNGIKVCKEEIQTALESEKINITGCVKIGKVEVCKNSEESSLFDEESQGFCVEWNGIKVCKEQIEAALEAYEDSEQTFAPGLPRCSSLYTLNTVKTFKPCIRF